MYPFSKSCNDYCKSTALFVIEKNFISSSKHRKIRNSYHTQINHILPWGGDFRPYFSIFVKRSFQGGQGIEPPPNISKRLAREGMLTLETDGWIICTFSCYCCCLLYKKKKQLTSYMTAFLLWWIDYNFWASDLVSEYRYNLSHTKGAHDTCTVTHCSSCSYFISVNP